MIDEIISHLNSELKLGVGRITVSVDETVKDSKTVSHKCCNAYGRPGTETIALLDMYTDNASMVPDREIM